MLQRLAVVLALVLLCSSTAEAARVSVKGRFPTQEFLGVQCPASTDSLVPASGVMIRGYFKWTGPISWTDSLVSTFGAPFNVGGARWVPLGVYKCVGWCADSLGNQSCPDSIVVRSRGLPWRLIFDR